MGNQHNTHVTNGLDVTVKVQITHPDSTKEEIWIDADRTRNVPTNKGSVTISVFDPNSKSHLPYETRILPSDQSVYIDKNNDGKPKIRRVKYGTLRDCYDDEH